MLVTRQPVRAYDTNNNLSWWKFQSVDTMKFSRDLAREKLKDASFDITIEDQVKAIADTGATHIAIATPYDDEFLPYLKKWVKAARDNKLKVWFRGNFSGWEGWFDYRDISREEHLNKTTQFILKNKELFQDGDIFSPCPECENGGPGDPRQTGDIEGFRKFMSDEYAATQSSFFKINRAVLSNFNSMNGDVAKLVMDKKTTQHLGGIVTIDHYVGTPQKLANDISLIAIRSGGRIVLGEFGAPIPDIHGDMTPKQQAEWLETTLSLLAEMPEVYGLNYWTNEGSSTQLWEDDHKPRLAVDVLKKYYIPATLEILIADEIGSKLSQSFAQIKDNKYLANDKGVIKIPYVNLTTLVSIQSDGYGAQETSMERLKKNNTIILTRENENITYKIKKLWSFLISSLRALVLAK